MGRKVSILSGIALLICTSLFAAQRTDRLDLIGGSTAPGRLDVYEDTDDGSNKTRIQAQAQAGDITYTLPPDDGDASEVLTTDGSGNLTWETGGGGSGDITQVGNVLSGAAGTASSNDVTFGNIQSTRIGSVSPGDATFTAMFVAGTSGNDVIQVLDGGAQSVMQVRSTNSGASNVTSLVFEGVSAQDADVTFQRAADDTFAITYGGGSGKTFSINHNGGWTAMTLSNNFVINEVGWASDVRIEGDNDDSLLLVDGSEDAVGIGFSTIDGATGKFHVNGTVGIGTTTPSEKLSILSADNTQGTNILAVRSNNLSQGIGLGYTDITTIGTNQTLNLSPNGTGMVQLTPQINLLSQGTSGGTYVYNGTVNAAYSGNSNAILWLNYAGFQAGNTQYRDTYIADGQFNPFFSAIGSTGNVGIGTTTPSRKLTVIGNVGVLGDATFTSINLAKIGNTTPADATFSAASVSGRLGVGTTTYPSNVFEVDGGSYSFYTDGYYAYLGAESGSQNQGGIKFGSSQNHEFGATATGAGSSGFYWVDRNSDSSTTVGGSYDAIYLSTAGSKIFQWKASSVEKAYIGVDGSIYGAGKIGIAGDATFGSINSTKIGNTTAADGTFTAIRITGSGDSSFNGITVNRPGGTTSCIMIRDTDDAGWTEVTALNGVLTATTDLDGTCDGA